MAYIAQKQIDNLKKLITPGKVAVIYGARRVGKTTLVQKFLEAEGAAGRALGELYRHRTIQEAGISA
jgi:predicted AAA+ superfamily ATPase